MYLYGYIYIYIYTYFSFKHINIQFAQPDLVNQGFGYRYRL